MDIREIKKLIDIFTKSDMTELEIGQGEQFIKMSRQTTAPVYAMPAAAPVYGPTPTIEQAKAGTETAKETECAIRGHIVPSPMVGTFYTAPSPGAKSFVEIGQRVAVGDTLCIIEAMKMFNQIEADKAGKISAILAENGQPVEFDQPLFVIED